MISDHSTCRSHSFSHHCLHPYPSSFLLLRSFLPLATYGYIFLVRKGPVSKSLLISTILAACALLIGGMHSLPSAMYCFSCVACKYVVYSAVLKRLFEYFNMYKVPCNGLVHYNGPRPYRGPRFDFFALFLDDYFTLQWSTVAVHNPITVCASITVQAWKRKEVRRLTFFGRTRTANRGGAPQAS